MASTSRTKGLRLTLGGAPNTPHRIVGVPGLYRADSPTPVGGDGDLVDEEKAKELHKDPTIPLALVDVKAADVDGLREQAHRDLVEARHGAAQHEPLNQREKDDHADALASVNPDGEEGQ